MKKLIFDTKEYKDFLALSELHDAYGKHVPGVRLGYGLTICSACGAIAEYESHAKASSQETEITKAERASEVLEAVGGDTSKHVSDLAFAHCLQLATVYPEHSGPLVNNRMLKMRGVLDLNEVKKMLLNRVFPDPSKCHHIADAVIDLAAFAIKILRKPDEDIMKRMLELTAAVGSKRNAAAESLAGYYKHFKIEPSIAAAGIVRKGLKRSPHYTGDHLQYWARLSKRITKSALKFSSLGGAVSTYELLRDIAPEKFKNPELIATTFAGAPEMLLRYYLDTKRDAGMIGRALVAKIKFIDKRSVPTKAERNLLGKILSDIHFGDREDRIGCVYDMEAEDTLLQLCMSAEEYLNRVVGVHLESNPRREPSWGYFGGRGFKGED